MRQAGKNRKRRNRRFMFRLENAVTHQWDASNILKSMVKALKLFS